MASRTKLLIRSKLGWAGSASLIAQNHAADLRGADIAGQVDPEPLLLEPREVLGEGLPIGIDLVVFEPGAVGRQQAVILRRDGIALAGNFSSDALKNLGGNMRIDQHGQLGLAEHVDEPGRDHQATSVDYSAGVDIGGRAYPGYPPVEDSNIAGIPGGAGAVDNVAVADEQIKLLCWRGERKG